MIEDFMSILAQVSLQPDKEDSRLWNDPPSYTFSVKSTYNKLGNHGPGGISVWFSLEFKGHALNHVLCVESFLE